MGRSAIAETAVPWEQKLRAWHLVALTLLPVLCGLGIGLPTLSRPTWLSPAAFGILQTSVLLLMGCILLYPLAGLILLISCFLPRLTWRRRLARALIAVVLLSGLALALFGGMGHAARSRRRHIVAAVRRLRPLTVALEQYYDAHGAYPDTLGQLVPDYLPHLPGTGMIGYHDLGYKLIKQDREWRRRPDRVGKEYELYIYCSLGFSNFDSLRYWPSERYPDYKWGGTIERMDGWAYVHE